MQARSARGKTMQISSMRATSSAYKVSPQVMNVTQALAALKRNSKLKISISDSSANIKNNLNALKAVNAQITQITFKSTDDKLNLNAEQFKSYSPLLSKVPDNTLVLTDSFDALNANLSQLRELNLKINKMILTPSASPNAKQTISPWDSQLWSKSVNGKFEIQTQLNVIVSGSATTPGTTTTTTQTTTVQPTTQAAKFLPFEDTQALASNYLGLKALDDMGMLSGIEAFKGSAITTNIAQGKALSSLFNKYATDFYLNIRDTTTNISKNIDFIASSNKKLASITQIGNIRPLEISRADNKKADIALSKMKNPYSIKFTM
jgi:hypothetical protein